MKTLAPFRIMLTSALFLICLVLSAAAEEKPLRVGHFPNLTHLQGLVAHQLSRQGNGWYEKRTGVQIEWYVFNAGPSAIESILTDSLDLTFIGPNPSINGFARTKGKDIRIIQGAARGGSALVVGKDSGITAPEAFRGKKLATPQFGNTQDIAARAWLIQHGFKISQSGGDVMVVPTENPEQLDLLKRGAIDAAWTVEPWVSRLEMEAGGRVFLEDREAITTVLTSSVKALNERRELVKKFAAATRELSEWIRANREAAVQLAQSELKAETTKSMQPELLEHAWNRLTFSPDLSREALDKSLDEAKVAGFLKDNLDFSPLVDLQ